MYREASAATTKGPDYGRDLRDLMQSLLEKIIARLMKMLIRSGYLVEEQGVSYLVDFDSDNPLRSLQAASVHLSHRAGSARWTEGAEFANGTQPGRENHTGAVRRSARLQPACRSALRGASAHGARTAVPLHHPPGVSLT